MSTARRRFAMATYLDNNPLAAIAATSL